MFRCFLILCLLAQQVCSAQDGGIDPQKRDSLIRSIEASAKALQASQDSFRKLQDSLYQSAQRSANEEQNIRNLTNLMNDIKKREDKQRQQAYFRLALGVVFLAVLIIGILRRRKKRQQP